jgi:hypothetical protein
MMVDRNLKSSESIATLPPCGPTVVVVVFPDFQPIRVSEEPVCIYLFRQNPELVFVVVLRGEKSIPGID